MRANSTRTSRLTTALIAAASFATLSNAALATAATASVMKSTHAAKAKVTSSQICGSLTPSEVAATLNGLASTGPGIPGPSSDAVPGCNWQHGNADGSNGATVGVSVSRSISKFSCDEGQTTIDRAGWKGCFERSNDTLDAQEGPYEVQIESVFNNGTGKQPDVETAQATAGTVIFKRLHA